MESGATIRNSVLMGADFYQDEEMQPASDGPPLGIGRNTLIEGAIIDKNARIGDGGSYNTRRQTCRCGRPQLLVVVVPKGAIIPAGSRI